MPERHLSHQKYHFAHIFPLIASFGLASQSAVKDPLPHFGHTSGEYGSNDTLDCCDFHSAECVTLKIMTRFHSRPQTPDNGFSRNVEVRLASKSWFTA